VSSGTPRQPSVVDIARATGVSPSTVCRALNDKGEINARTKRKIIAASTRLGYVRNAAASNLRLSRADTIACLMPDGDNELLIDKLHHLKREVHAAGYQWRISPYRDDAERDALLHEILASRPAGLVLKGRLTAGSRRRVVERVAAVAYDDDVPGVDSVVLERSCGVRDAVEYLFSKGRTRILLLGGDLVHARGKGYREAHESARVPIDPALVVDEPFGRDLYSYGYLQTSVALSRVQFDALAAVNDACAIGAMRALREARIDVPGDVSVVGFDNIMASQYTVPSLTTIAQPVEQMAALAFEFLQKRISRRRSPRRVARLGTTLVVRESA
jgi:DNA-binding LacI/PurR family transcriptional regulator